jgi:hypothetical protein
MERRIGLVAFAVPAAVVLAVVAVPLVLQLIIGSDYERSPIDVDHLDLGARVIVEPGDEFTVALFGDPAHTDAAWALVTGPGTGFETLSARHEPKASEAPPPEILEEMPDSVRERWTNLPERSDPPDYVGEGEPPMWFWPMSFFEFAGGDVGTTEMTFELAVGGTVVEWFAFSVQVVDGDACDFFIGQDAAVKVPHRCG